MKRLPLYIGLCVWSGLVYAAEGPTVSTVTATATVTESSMTVVASSGTTPPPVVETPVASTLPSGSADDISDEVLDLLMQRLNCKVPSQKEQIRFNCIALAGFKKGVTPRATPSGMGPWVARIFLVDAYGRFEGVRFDALAVRNGELGYGTIKTTNALEDYELKEVLDAKLKKKPMPDNAIAQQVASVTQTGTITIVGTKGKSGFFTTPDNRRFLVRLVQDQWIILYVDLSPFNDASNASFSVGLFL